MTKKELKEYKNEWNNEELPPAYIFEELMTEMRDCITSYEEVYNRGMGQKDRLDENIQKINILTKILVDFFVGEEKEYIDDEDLF